MKLSSTQILLHFIKLLILFLLLKPSQALLKGFEWVNSSFIHFLVQRCELCEPLSRLIISPFAAASPASFLMHERRRRRKGHVIYYSFPEKWKQTAWRGDASVSWRTATVRLLYACVCVCVFAGEIYLRKNSDMYKKNRIKADNKQIKWKSFSVLTAQKTTGI